MSGLLMSSSLNGIYLDKFSTNKDGNGNTYVDKWQFRANPPLEFSQGSTANFSKRDITGGFSIGNQQIKNTYYINNVVTFDKPVDGILSYTENGNSKSVYLVNSDKYEFTSQYEMKNIDVSQLNYSTGAKVDFNQDSNFYKDSSGTSDKLQNKNDVLSDSVKNYTDMENNYMNQMHDNFNDVKPDSDLLKQNGFLNSAKWVSSQFNNLVDVQTSDGSQPFKLMLFFSLILGIALIMIGKIRG